MGAESGQGGDGLASGGGAEGPFDSPGGGYVAHAVPPGFLTQSPRPPVTAADERKALSTLRFFMRRFVRFHQSRIQTEVTAVKTRFFEVVVYIVFCIVVVFSSVATRQDQVSRRARRQSCSATRGTPKGGKGRAGPHEPLALPCQPCLAVTAARARGRLTGGGEIPPRPRAPRVPVPILAVA